MQLKIVRFNEEKRQWIKKRKVMREHVTINASNNYLDKKKLKDIQLCYIHTHNIQTESINDDAHASTPSCLHKSTN